MDIRETPWLTPESIAFLEQLVSSNPEMKVLEFGCGGSTIWLSRKLQFPQARLVTVEHDPEWYQAIRSRVGAGVEMHLKQRPYAGICNDFPDDYFDLVLIDGRNRVLCAAHAMRIVKPGGFIMLDNAERREYTPIGSVLLQEWQYKRTAERNCPEAAADGVWTTDIWRKPLSRNVANVADDVLVAHGETAALRGDFESAEALARLSLEKNEHVADALNLLAIASCSKEQVNDAHRLLEAGYTLEPANANVGRNLAMICAKLGLREEAQGIHNDLLVASNESETADPGRSASAEVSGTRFPIHQHRRARVARDVCDPRPAVETARELFSTGRQFEALDLYEQIAEAHPGHSVEIMADTYDCYAAMPDQNDRYNLYQARLFDFDIKPTDKVLDVGSGHAPFPLATHLADLDLGEGWTGRAGAPFKHIDGKPVYQCNIESLPFADKEFDFVYCSHVLEHAANPEAACSELMRVAKRGYIETPTRGKDLWFDTARVSNHRWAIELFNDTLIFTEYSERDIDGLHCDVIGRMHMHPESPREKAITSLQYLKADRFNTMLMWDGSFKYEVRRIEDRSAAPSAPAPVPDPSQARQPDNVFTAGQDATEDWLRQTALRINQADGDPEKLTTIAGELAEHGHDDTAEELARMVISQNPSFADAHNVLGVIYHSRGKSRDALRYFETANRLAPGNTDIGQNLVTVYTQVDQFEKAVEVCQKMLASNPTDARLPEMIGALLQTISDTALSALDTLGAAAQPETRPTQIAEVRREQQPTAQPAHKPKLKYSFGMIVLNGDDFIEYAIRSVYDFAHEIIIVEGAVQEATFMVGPDGGSRDKTIELIESFPDPDDKIKLIRGRWADKTEQSNVYMRLATGDYVWQIDSDEVYKWEDLVKLDEILAANQDRVDMVSITALNFYHNLWTTGKGGRWEDPFRRIFKNKPGAHFTTHWPPTLVYGDGSTVAGHLEQDTLAQQFGIYLYHYSYVTRKQVEEKVEYYNRKGYSPVVGSDLSTWYDEVWSKWTHPGCEVEKLHGSHVNRRQPTWTEYFTGEHPEVMKTHPLFDFERPSASAPDSSGSSLTEFRNLAGEAQTGCFAPVFRSLLQAHGYEAPAGHASDQINKERHGTEYGGWWICPDGLDRESVIYSFGIGEDISFDRSIIDKFGAHVHAFDPTPRALDYVKKQRVPRKMHVQGLALAAHDGEELFYPPENTEHVSHTLMTKPQTAASALKVNVKRLGTIMRELGHTHIDLLKMDIEGSEYEVLADILDSGIDVDQILVEFHHNVYPSLTLAQSQAIADRLIQAGYDLFSVEGSDCSFIKKRQMPPVRIYNLGGRSDSLDFYAGQDAAWLGSNIEYRTVDINPNFHPDICNSVEDMRDIPDASADVVLSTQVLMYTPNPHKAFQEISRVLKPGGTFFCVTPMLYPRGEPINEFYRDCTRIYSDSLLTRQSCLQQLQRFTDIYGVDASPENLKQAMCQNDAGHPAYNVYDLKQAEELFSEIHVYPAYDSPKAGTINVVIVVCR